MPPTRSARKGWPATASTSGAYPHFNADVEAEEDPEPVRELKGKIRAYDAVLIASPEYDYAVPGVLTTALDWCLRSPLAAEA